MDSDGMLYLGANAVAKTYADNEFKDPHFVAYVRRPSSITISADGKHAGEHGAWTGINTAPEHVYSGTYLASWQKYGATWKIVYEAFSELDLAPQDVVDALHPAATFALGGTPDWLAVTQDSVWISNDALKAVQRVDVRTNILAARIKMPGAPCSGLAYGFGSLWVPLCGAHPSLARVDPARNVIAAILPIGPALSEGGITISGDSVWLVTGNGVLSRIDPTTNHIRQKISIARGSYNPLFSDGTIWVTSGEKDVLTALDASRGNIIATIPVGSQPHFLTAGEGAVWTLNQGDGSVTKVDAKRKRVVATIVAGAPGAGGDITYGGGSVWATIIGLPLTRIDARTSAVRSQWGGRGGDAARFGHQSIWLTDYFSGRLWRIPVR
jgi:streptogramin lyase